MQCAILLVICIAPCWSCTRMYGVICLHSHVQWCDLLALAFDSQWAAVTWRFFVTWSMHAAACLKAYYTKPQAQQTSPWFLPRILASVSGGITFSRRKVLPRQGGPRLQL